MPQSDETLRDSRLEVPASEAPGKAVPKWAGLAVAVIVPLLFVAMFAIAYISAFHAPAPHHAPLALVGPAAVTDSVIQEANASSPDAFDFTSNTELEPALSLLHARDVIGVVEIRAHNIVAHTAAAAGNGTAVTVTSTANTLAASMGLPVTVVDEVPTAGGDGTGIALFYMLMICTIGAYIAIMVLPGVAGSMKLPGRFAFVGVIAVLAPVLTFALASLFVGNFGLGASSIAALVAVGVLYTFTVGTIALFAERLVGQASMILTMALIMVLNLPSSGGPMAAAVLPAFWQWMHSFWFGSAAMESMRNIAYFPDADNSGQLTVLLLWALSAVIAVLVLEVMKRGVGTRSRDVAA